MQPFDQLTKRGQTGRLRLLALAALDAYGLVPGRVELLSDGFNTLFRVDATRGTGPKVRYVVRAHRADERSPGGFEAEHRWLTALANELDHRAGFSVPRLVPTRDGAPFFLQAHEGVPEPRKVSVFHWQPGKTLSKMLTPERAFALGRVAAGLHAHSDRFRALDNIAPRHKTLFGAVPDALATAMLTPSLAGLVARARERCDAVFAAHQRRPIQLCHFDLHPENVLVGDDDRLAVLDFDDCAVTWPAFDLAVALFYLRVMPAVATGVIDPARDAQLALRFRAGYTSLRAWPASDDDTDTFVIARQLVLLNHLIQERDPAHRESLPDYLLKVEPRLAAWLER